MKENIDNNQDQENMIFQDFIKMEYIHGVNLKTLDAVQLVKFKEEI